MTAKPDDERIYHATLTSKGQLTVPKELREALKLEVGSRVTFIARGETVTVQPGQRRRRDFREALGTLTLPDGMSVDEYVSDLRHDPGDRETLQSGPGVKKITYVEDLLRQSREG